MKKFTKLLKEKRWRWTAGGVLCLVVASIIFALSADFGAEAVTLNGTDVTLNQNNGVYEIVDYSVLKALGNSSLEETSNKKFKLVSDIVVTEEVTSAAMGTFAGEFDGNGHVITFDSINISNDTVCKDNQIGGLLFGTVSGKVENVIVEITDKDAADDFSRTISGTVTQKGRAVYQYTESSPKSEQSEIAAISKEEVIDGKKYKIETVTETGTETTEYEAVTSGTDSFGLICGKLESTGTLNQIGLFGADGNSIGIKRTMATTDKYPKYIQGGTRTKTYKYEVVETPEQTELENSNENELKVISTKYEAGNNTQSAKLENALEVAVSAPKNVSKENGTQIQYQIVLTKSAEITIDELKITTGLNDAVASGTEIVFDTNNTATITYNYSVVDNTQPVKMQFKVTGNIPAVDESSEAKSLEILVPEVNTTIRDTLPSSSEKTIGTQLYQLQGTLSVDKQAVIGDGSFEYTLTLKNEHNADVFTLTNDLNGWSIDTTSTETEFVLSTKQVLNPGKQIVLKKTGSSSETVSITPVGYWDQSVITYTYDETKTVTSDFVPSGTPSTEGELIIAGNDLYAGAIAGTSAGTITAVKETLNLTGTNVNAIGGVTGSAISGALKDIYMLGKVNGESIFVGNGTVSPVGSASTLQTSIPDGATEWTTYNEYAQSGEMISASTHADLKWLVKDVSFSYSEPYDNKIIVSLSDNIKVTSKDLSGISVGYTARKNLQASENQAYYSDQGIIELGDSGFYKVLAAYATDGYYHYRENDTSTNTVRYPYPEKGPFEVISANVVRSKVNPLEDVVEMTISPTLANGGKIYYVVNSTTTLPGTGTNSSETTLNSNGIASVPFKESSEQYRMVVVSNGHIYPAFLSGTYNINQKKELPKPNVSVFDYYNANGEKKAYSSFGNSGTSYIAGEEMIIQPYGSETYNYSFRYMFSHVAPVNEHWVTNETEEYYNNRYKGNGNDTSFDAMFTENALNYTDSAIIPKDYDENQDVYLYVEVSKKNYNSAIYCFGPISISQKDVLKATLPSANGYTAVNGDIMKISGAPIGTTVEYFISKTPTSSYSGTWLTYQSNTGILMNENVGNYVYARIKYDSEKYSEWFEFACAFGGECAEPNITPNTGAATGNVETDTVIGSAVGSTTPISLSSRTANAHIFYLLSDAKQTMNLERVDKVPEEVTKDGDYNNAKTQRYFKVGERWYRTDNANVERYVESIHLFNDTANVKLAYISSVAVADGYKVSNARNYVYRIKQAQQVASPEAALETSCSPSTEKFEVANVALGSSLSFYSVTPEAELYYAIGSGTEEPTLKVPEGGILVEGTYGENFVVRIQAKKEGMLPSEVISFVYKISDQEMASTPTATPGTSAEMPTVILPGNKILLSTDTKEALIYYTLDGSSPVVTVSEEGVFSSGNEATKLYDPTVGIDMPEEGKDYFTITAVAVKNGLAKSAEAHFTYSFPATVLAPYANFASGKVELNEVILLKSLTENAVIYYNVAYGETIPEDPTISSSVFNEAYPFTITQKTTIKAMAVKDNVKSEIVTFTFDPMAKLSAPTASIQSGSVVSRGTVLQLKADTGATIYYTMDGSDPMDSTNASVMMGDSLVLNGEAEAQITIKAYAVAPDKSKSEVVTFTYSFSQNSGGVTASIENGSTVSNGTKVNLISDVTDGDIYYTTDGSSPVSNGKKGTTVEIEGEPGSTFTVKAVVIVNDEPGTIATFIYKIQECPDAPTASPAGGTLTVATRVTLSAGTEKIYYTTDGTEPTKSSALYSEPILINRATVLKAIAVSEEGEISDVATFVYEAALKASSVKSSSADGDILEPGAQIYLSTTTDGAKIYYSTDGTEPNMDNLDSMLVYDGDFIEINRDVTIRAVAYRKDLRLSDVQTWSYFVDRIPAVEQKEAEAEKLAEEGLKDTDASELVRENVKDTEKVTKTVRERTYKTAVIYTSDAFQGNVALETIKEDDNPYAIKKAKSIYGDDTTVLESYKVKVKSGSSGVQPKEAVEIAFPIPKGYEDAALSVALVKDDYNLTTLETRREAKVLYVKTEKVGSYVIIGPERLNEEQSQFPYLLVLEVAAGITLAGGLFFCLSEKIKKIKKNK